MKTICSTNGYNFEVSDIDYDCVKRLGNWHYRINRGDINSGIVCRTDYSDGYLRTISLANVIAERMGMDLSDGKTVDHIDKNPLNNQRENLRPATKSQQAMNRGLSTKNKTGFKGVFYCKTRKKFIASIRVDGQRIYLGEFKTDEEAGREYDHFARRWHGPFARLNFPGPGEQKA